MKNFNEICNKIINGELEGDFIFANGCRIFVNNSSSKITYLETSSLKPYTISGRHYSNEGKINAISGFENEYDIVDFKPHSKQEKTFSNNYFVNTNGKKNPLWKLQRILVE